MKSIIACLFCIVLISCHASKNKVSASTPAKPNIVYKSLPENHACTRNLDCYCIEYDGVKFDFTKKVPGECCLEEKGCKGYDANTINFQRCITCLYE